MSEARPPVRAAIFYHRPIDDPYHGGSRHCQGFAKGLAPYFAIEFVGPRLPRGWAAGQRDRGGVRLAVVGYLLRAFAAAARFVLADGSRGSADRARLVIAFDVYLGGIAAVWSRIRRVEMVYYPQDSPHRVAQGWTASGVRGAWLFRAFRALPERWSVRAASVVLVPSPSVGRDYAELGIDPRRIRLCPMNREAPTYRPAAVEEWRRRLDLQGRTAAIFVGSFQYPPNVRAFEYLRDSLAPRLQERAPSVEILVAGLDSEAFASGLPRNVRVLGTVDDLDSLLFACSIGLAPMDVPGGTSGKVIDFLLHGLPTVATPQAANGVAPSPLLRVVPLASFPDAVTEADGATAATGASPAPRSPDPEYLRLYAGEQELRSIAADLATRAAPPSAT